jgi:hypothetical protein
MSPCALPDPTAARLRQTQKGRAAPGAPHRLTRAEVIVCIEGQARATVAGVDYELEAGGAAVMDGDTFVPPWAR